MYRNLLIILSVLFMFGCNGKTEEEKLVIEESKMIDVLYDVHLAEGIADFRKYNTTEKFVPYSSIEMFKSVLVKHSISVEQFQKSLYYYNRKTRQMDKIYQQVLDRFNKEREKIDEKRKGLDQERKLIKEEAPEMR